MEHTKKKIGRLKQRFNSAEKNIANAKFIHKGKRDTETGIVKHPLVAHKKENKNNVKPKTITNWAIGTKLEQIENGVYD